MKLGSNSYSIHIKFMRYLDKNVESWNWKFLVDNKPVKLPRQQRNSWQNYTNCKPENSKGIKKLYLRVSYWKVVGSVLPSNIVKKAKGLRWSDYNPLPFSFDLLLFFNLSYYFFGEYDISINSFSVAIFIILYC